MAAAVGVSASTVGRIWRAHGLKPHRVKTFKLSNDPRFAEKLDDIIDFISTRPSMPSFFASTRSHRFKPSTAPSPAYP